MKEVAVAEDDPVVVDNMPSVPEARSDDQAQLQASQKENSSNVNNKKRKVIFQYGNYNRYYGYRVGGTLEADPRMSLMQKSWFENKDVIDIGCNEGHVTISLVQKYRVRSMCGIDIDPGLIHKAWKNLEHEAVVTGAKTVKTLYEWGDYVYGDEMDYYDDDDEKPALTESSVGATTSDHIEGGLQGKELLERVIFKNANVLHCDLRRNIVDTVLCLSVVKWIHLNWGDEGLLEFFIKTYRALRPMVGEMIGWSVHLGASTMVVVCTEVQSIRGLSSEFQDHDPSTRSLSWNSP